MKRLNINKNEKFFEWIPNERVGNIRYDMIEDERLNEMGYVVADFQPEGEHGDWVIYENEAFGLQVSVERETRIVQGVSSEKVLCFDGVNLIGKSQQEIEELFSNQTSAIGPLIEYENGDVQKIIEFNELGLLLFSEKDSVVSAATYSV